jgi:arylsulfatase A-like enzyme
MNIVLITIDCLRADHLSCMGYERQTSPFMDSLAEKGMLFTQAIINGVGTFASFPALMTSTYPFMHGGYERLNRKPIAEVLQNRGYVTAGLNANSFLSPYFGYDRGFDYFDCLNPKERKPRAGRITEMAKRLAGRNVHTLKFATRMKHLVFPQSGGMGGERLNREASSWLSRNYTTGFFLWIHYMDVHGPHYAPREYFRRIGYEPPSHQELISLNSKLSRAAKSHHREGKLIEAEIELLKATYDAEIRYVDDRIKELFNRLRDLGIDKDTAAIITGDHGEEFFEHGNYHWHENFHDEMLRVPLIVYSPAISPGRIDRQVEHIDIAPTILHLANQDEEASFIGKSLLADNPGSEYVISEAALDYASGSRTQKIVKISFDVRKTSIRFEKGTAKWKYINSTKENEEELYDLASDPFERDNLVGIKHGRVEEILVEFRTRLQAHFKLEEEQRRVRQKIRRLKNGRYF